MKKLLALMFLFATCVFSATSLVQDTIKTQFSSVKFNGRMHFTAQAFTTDDGVAMGAWEIDVQVTDGKFSNRFEVTDATIRVDYFPTSGHGTTWTEYWQIPSSATPLQLKDVRVSSSVTPAIPATISASSPLIFTRTTGVLQFDPTANFTWTGAHNFSAGSLLPPARTVATMPSAASSTGKMIVTTDCSSASDCSVAGSPGVAVLRRSDGDSWVSLGGASAWADITGKPTFYGGSTMLKGNGSGGTAAATYSDVFSLFSGCSSSMYPGADGTCHSSLLSLNGLTATSQTFARTNDTNVTLTLTSNTSTHTFALGWTGQLSVARGGTGASSLTGLLRGNGTGAFTAAAYGDIFDLFSGCSGSMYPGADGACHAVSTGISGTQYKLTRFATASTLGDSHISEDATTGQITTDRLISTAPCALAYNASLTLDFRDCDTIVVGALTGNVSSITFSNLKPGAHLTVNWTQDATGGRTVTMPAGASNLCAVEPTASKSTAWQMDVASDGSSVVGTGCPTNLAWVQWSGPTGSGCSSTSAATLCAWFDSSANTIKVKDASGNTYAAVKTASGATANQFLTYIDSSGVQHTAAIAAGDLPATVMQTNTTNTVTGYNNLSGGTWRAPETLAASLPTASTVTGRLYVVTDAARIGDCSTTGGGTKVVGCRSNGTTYDCVWRCAVTIASGSTAMGTSAISSGTCATVVTATATGTLTTDVLTASFSADPTSTTGFTPSATGMLTIIPYPTANTANFKVCNLTSSSITPGAVTINWRVAQ